MLEIREFINHRNFAKRTYQIKLKNHKNAKVMERRDLLKKLMAVTAGTIVGIPLVSAAIKENPKFNVDLVSDFEVEAGGWNSLAITNGDDVFWNGVWTRKLTDDEITILYNNGCPLTYGEIASKKLLPNRRFQMWVNGKLKIENGEFI